MQVTIVIPACNAQPTIGATIDSVRAQTYAEWELIVVDGGSSDHTYDIAFDYSQRDARVYALQQPACANTVAACNLGIAERSRASRYILVLEPGDLLVNDALASLVELLESDKKAVAAYGRFRLIDMAGRHLKTLAADRFTDTRLAVGEGGAVTVLPSSSPLTFAALAIENCVKSTGQMLVRADALRRLGPFDPAAFPCDDWDMWIRLSLLGDIRMLDRIVLEYRTEGEGAGLADLTVEPGELYLRRKLVHTMIGEDLEAVALAGWRVRERRLIGRRLRSAVTIGMAGRRSEAVAEVLAASRDLAAYLYHWGIWRDSEDLPRHAGRPDLLRPAALGV